jgi:hypothetical protein
LLNQIMSEFTSIDPMKSRGVFTLTNKKNAHSIGE